MLSDDLFSFFKRDLEKLKTELELYKNEENIWITDRNISNSAGNLCLHLVGNLNAFVGAVIGKTGYIRDRPLEFSLKNVSRATLMRQIDDTVQMLKTSIGNLTDAQLNEAYPEAKFEKPQSIAYLLIHLEAHLTYHLGQINYHRRLLDC